MIGHAFEARGRVFLLTYGGETRVWDLGSSVSAATASLNLGHDYATADSDSEAWGRLILEKRQGGEALPCLSPTAGPAARCWW